MTDNQLAAIWDLANEAQAAACILRKLKHEHWAERLERAINRIDKITG